MQTLDCHCQPTEMLLVLGDRQQDSQNWTASSSCSRSERTNQESAQATNLSVPLNSDGGRETGLQHRGLFFVPCNSDVGGVGGRELDRSTGTILCALQEWWGARRELNSRSQRPLYSKQNTKLWKAKLPIPSHGKKYILRYDLCQELCQELNYSSLNRSRISPGCWGCQLLAQWLNLNALKSLFTSERWGNSFFAAALVSAKTLK